MVRAYRVHVVDEATVVNRGERVRVWLAPLGDGWVRAADHPNAEIEAASAERGDPGCPPGTIWTRSIELTLPAGSLLRCHYSEPSAERLDPLEYLKRGKLSVGRIKRETVHRVVGNYRLEVVRAAPGARKSSKS